MKKTLALFLSCLLLLSVVPLAPVAVAATPHVEFDVGVCVDGVTPVSARLVDCVGLTQGYLEFAYPDGTVTKCIRKVGKDARAIGDIDNAFSSELISDCNPIQYGFYFKTNLWDPATWAAGADEMEQGTYPNGENFEFAVFQFTSSAEAEITVTGTLRFGDVTQPVATSFTVGRNVDFMPGDVDGDDNATAADARLTLRCAAKLENFEAGTREFLAADFDRNGAVEAADARKILRSALRLPVDGADIPDISPHHPSIGFDVTPGTDSVSHNVAVRLVDCVGLTSGCLRFQYPDGEVSQMKVSIGTDAKLIDDIDNPFAREFNANVNPAEFHFYFMDHLWNNAGWQEAADEKGLTSYVNGENFECARLKITAEQGTTITVTGVLCIGKETVSVWDQFSLDHRHVFNATYENVISPASCDNWGQTEIVQKCTICGYEETVDWLEIAPTGHNYGPWEPMNDDFHQMVCRNDASHVLWEAHAWDAGVETTPATTEKEGEITYTCSVCGQTKTETEPKVTTVESGTLGEHATYALYSNGHVVVSGAGPITDSFPRWLRGNVRTLEIGDGITAVCDRAFRDCKGLTDLTVADSVVSVGVGAFDTTEWLNRQPEGPVYLGKVLYKMKGAPAEKTITVAPGTVSIADNAFYCCLGLEGVRLPAGLVSIGANAFSGCADLKDINNVDTVTSIGQDAFADTAWMKAQPQGEIYYGKVLCGYKGVMADGTELSVRPGTVSIAGKALRDRKGLARVTLPDTVTTIVYAAFAGCTGLTEVTLPDSVAELGECAFADCTSMTACDGGSGLLTIGKEAFVNCAALARFSLPGKVISIGKAAFRNCGSLPGVVLPDSLVDLGTYVFENCTSLQTAVIGAGLTGLPYDTFSGCKSLREINIPGNIQDIDSRAFSGCEGLAKVTFQSGLTRIAPNAFEECTSLKSVTIPDSVTQIYYDSFSGCTSLETIEVNKKNPAYFSLENCVIEKESGLVVMGCKNSRFPADKKVKGLSGYVFSNCKGLTTAEIPENITQFGGYVFMDCEDLNKVTLPDNITQIVYGTFMRCTSLPSIKLPDSLASIGHDAFNGCASLKSITIPKNVKEIGARAFSGCSSLGSITVAKGNPVYYAKGNCLIEKETSTLVFGCGASKIPADGSVRIIGADAFSGLQNQTYMVIPEGVERIGNRAFADCDRLTGVRIPVSVTSIGWDALPEKTAVIGIPGSYAQQWAIENDRMFIAAEEAFLTMKAPATFNEPVVKLSGFATADAEVVVSVKGKEVARVSSESGKWAAEIPLTGATDGASFKISASLTFNGKTVSETADVVYDTKAVVFRSLRMEHVYGGATVTADDPGALLPNITFVPGQPVSFMVGVTNNEQIGSLWISSVKAEDVKKMALTYNAVTGLWYAAGYFDDADHNYVPGEFRIEGTDKDGKAFDTGIVIRFRFLIDPSGYVYEAVQSNVLKDVQATVFYIDAQGNERPWNAAAAEQLNPIYTLQDGAFAWVVPEGKWQVRVTKEGYAPAASEWMDVPPEWKNVYIPMVSEESPRVSSVKLYAGHADIVFSQYMEIDSVNAETFVFEGYDGTFLPLDKTETAPGSGVYYATSFRFTPKTAFIGEVNVKCASEEVYNEVSGQYEYNGPKNYAGKSMESWRAYSETLVVSTVPDKLTAPKTAESVYGQQTEITLQAENAAGMTVAVAADNALAALSDQELRLNADGRATLVVTGLMPGVTKLTFTLVGSGLTAETAVAVTLPERPDVTVGDVNGDGKIGSDDARLALRASVKLETIEEGSVQFEAADADRNGKIESADARLILRASVKLEDLTKI